MKTKLTIYKASEEVTRNLSMIINYRDMRKELKKFKQIGLTKLSGNVNNIQQCG